MTTPLDRAGRLRLVQPAPDLLTVEQVGARLHCSRSKVFLLFRDEGLRSIKVGRRRLVAIEDLEAYVRSKREDG